MGSTARPFVLHEATYKQTAALKPNLAILPWGATEAHGYHLPHGCDVIEAVALSERAVQRANERGCRCVLLPPIPFGMNHCQLYQVATISVRTRTQHAILFDVADSLLQQGISRLVVLNFHGGNEFKSMIRDVMHDLPIFIAQIHGFAMAEFNDLLQVPEVDHADEFETSLLLHLVPQWVDMEAAGEGSATPSALPAFTTTPGVWAPRDWQAATADTGIGNPTAARPEKGRAILDRLVERLTPILVELSNAHNGDFPFFIPSRRSPKP